MSTSPADAPARAAALSEARPCRPAREPPGTRRSGSREQDRFVRERARAGAQGFVEAILKKTLDRLLVGLRDGPVQQVVRANVAPSLLPGSPVRDQGDPDISRETEVVAAVQAHVVVRAQLLRFERDAAARAVRRQQDLG